MPPRTNLFQRVVRILHENLAGEATVEESAMLEDTATGSKREVDVAITTTVAGHQVVVGVEARDSRRKADASWVDMMLGKHETLPTDKVVLVSQAGFSEEAKAKAAAGCASTISPEDLDADDPVGVVVNKLGAIYPKSISLSFDNVRVTATDIPGTDHVEMAVPPQTPTFFESGAEFRTLAQIAHKYLSDRFLEIAEEVDLANITETQKKRVTIGGPAPSSASRTYEDGTVEEGRLCLAFRNEGTGEDELWPLQSITLKGELLIEAGEIPLMHRKMPGLADAYSFGEGQLGGKAAAIVLTETKDGLQGKLIVEGDDGVEEGRILGTATPDGGTNVELADE